MTASARSARRHAPRAAAAAGARRGGAPSGSGAVRGGWLAGRSRGRLAFRPCGRRGSPAAQRRQRDRARAAVLGLGGVRPPAAARTSVCGRPSGARSPGAGPARVARRTCRTPPWRAMSASAAAAPVLDLLEPEEDHRDVVPPARVVGRRDQPRGRSGRSDPPDCSSRFELRLVDHRGQPVGADEEHVARARRVDVEVDLHGRLGPQRARDHRALRVRLRLLLGELAARHELADQRVVAGEPHEVAAAQQVAARVAHVRDHDGVVGHVGGGERRAHARALAVRARALVDARVGAPR